MSNLATGIGYAIKSNKGINVDTIYSSERGAMVNWLVKIGIRVTQNWTDEQIYKEFERLQNYSNEKYILIEVSINEVKKSTEGKRS